MVKQWPFKPLTRVRFLLGAQIIYSRAHGAVGSASRSIAGRFASLTTEGLMAQLVARFNGIEEVASSNLAESTKEHCANMELLLFIIISLSGGFVGFALGRIGDKYLGYMSFMHHWIYGLILIVFGIIYFNTYTGIFLLSLGIGHFLSDLDDFLNFRIWGADVPHEWKFWSVK